MARHPNPKVAAIHHATTRPPPAQVQESTPTAKFEPASTTQPIARSVAPPPRVALVSDVTAADLDVVFQPIVDLRQGATFAYEALTRCKWPEFKNPMKLFEQAQEERCCGRLGRSVREVAFARCTDAPLFVNIHPHELDEGWLVRPDDPLFFHDRPVYLEITESAAFTYFSLCVGVLKEICSRGGAYLVVDDLGAGHSNLKRIIDLEPHVVKLDLALVRGIEKSRRQQTLVTHVVALCRDLGARVVAEGIETVEELKAVIDTGAEYGQGYLFARPAFPIPKPVWPLTPESASSKK